MKVFVMIQRHADIVDLLSRQDRATVRELSERTGVSEVTIRQDLSQLERDGLLRRVHGGATLLETDNIARRLTMRHEAKLAIARAAAALVEEGETVLIESGSANVLLARELSGRGVQLVTNSLFVARQIKPGDKARVAVVGGASQPESEALVGSLAKLGIRETVFTKAFLGMDGYTPEAGFTNRDMMRAEFATAVIEHSRTAYIVGDSSKFGRTGMARFGTLEDIAGVITDAELMADYITLIRKSSAALVLADV